MALTTQNTDAISFKKLSGKAHTDQNFSVSEEGISTNVQFSYTTVFAQPIEPLPVTNSGYTGLYSGNGIIQRVKFQIDIIPNTQLAVGQSQGYRLKLPSDWNSFGDLYPQYSAGTYLHTALGKLQIVPPLYGKLKGDGSTEYDPILYQTNGTTQITKFDAINWYFDPYDGILFVEDPKPSYDTSPTRPGFLEAFLYVGDYLNDVIFKVATGTTATTAINVGGGVGVFKDKITTTGGTEVLRFKSLIGVDGISISATSNDIVIGLTGSTIITGATNGLSKVGENIVLGGTLDNSTSLELKSNILTLIDSASTSNYYFAPSIVSFTTVATGSSYGGLFTLSPNTSITSSNTTTGSGSGLQISKDGSFGLNGNDNVGNSMGIDYNSFGGFTQMINGWSGGTVNDIRFQNHLGGGLLFNIYEGWTVNSYFNNIGGFNGFDFNDPSRIMFTGNFSGFTGLQYAVDYSSRYVDRSLVDKGWVLGVLSASGGSFTTASNGLTKVVDDVRLGGFLTNDTTIYTSGHTFSIIGNGTFDQINILTTGATTVLATGGFIIGHDLLYSNISYDNLGNLQTSTSGTTSIFSDKNITLQSSSRGINLNASTGVTLQIGVGSAKYASDYSSFFTKHSLVDVAYVTGKTAIVNNNFVFGTGTGIAAHSSQYTGNEAVVVVMTQTPPTIISGGSMNNVFVFGEGMTIFGSPSQGGTVTDSAMFGFGHTIGDTNSFFAGAGTLTYGQGNTNAGNSSLVGGSGGRVIGNVGFGQLYEQGAVAIGLTTQLSGTELVTAYRNAVNISSNSTAQITGHGAYGSLSVILGGQDHDIPIGGSRSAIIGGNGIKALSAVTDTVYLPKLRIGRGIGGSLTTGSTSQNFLVVDGTTGEVQIATNTSSGVATKFSTTISGNSTTTLFTITHNKNTRDVIVQVYDAQSFDTVVVDVVRNGVNTVQINFVSAPTTGTNYRVIVI